jgi:serine/threonine protein kinase
VNYAAPESFKADTIHTRKIDVYAFGLVMYEILTETAVFPISDYAFPIMKRILGGEMPAVPVDCGSLMQKLVTACWSMDPEKRPTIDDIVRDFKAADLRIVPRADAARLRTYVADIEEWEAKESAQLRSK